MRGAGLRGLVLPRPNFLPRVEPTKLLQITCVRGVGETRTESGRANPPLPPPRLPRNKDK
jgi:hypothetical protein